MNPIRLGIKRDALKESEDVIGSLNYVFTRQIEANPDAEKLQVYALSAGFYQPNEPADKMFDGEYKYYIAERIESKFLPFIAGYRDCFKFSATVLGWIKNPTNEQLDTLVPTDWPHTLGRTFREYFGQKEEINGGCYYSMHTFWEGENINARPYDADDTEFWLFYDHFGKAMVVLDSEKPRAL
jgi:hypothetical protein